MRPHLELCLETVINSPLPWIISEESKTGFCTVTYTKCFIQSLQKFLDSCGTIKTNNLPQKL